jgi:hypothetical protein
MYDCRRIRCENTSYLKVASLLSVSSKLCWPRNPLIIDRTTSDSKAQMGPNSVLSMLYKKNSRENRKLCRPQGFES